MSNWADNEDSLRFMLADANETENDSLDELHPVPRAGLFFAELLVREEATTDNNVIVPGQNREAIEDDVTTKRARVVKLGPAREGEAWDFEEGWHVVVPYHAGNHFYWQSRPGIEEHRWIIDAREPLAVFKPRKP